MNIKVIRDVTQLRKEIYVNFSSEVRNLNCFKISRNFIFGLGNQKRTYVGSYFPTVS